MRSPQKGKIGSTVMSRLEQLRARHNNVKRASGAELAKSKERLSREQIARVHGLNWYSQRFNDSGRRFYMDTSETGGEVSDSNSGIFITQKVPLHVTLKRENERLRRKLEKTDSERKVLKKRVFEGGAVLSSTEKTILKTKLREAKALYSALELELRETKNELSERGASTRELMEKTKYIKEAYDNLANQMESRQGNIPTIAEERNVSELQAEVTSLKDENKRLLLEKALSSRDMDHNTDVEPDSTVESYRNMVETHKKYVTMYKTKLSVTAAELSHEEKKVMETTKELKDTQNVLGKAQSLIHKLTREKEALVRRMEDRLKITQRSKLDSNQRSTESETSKPCSYGVSIVVDEMVGSDKIDKGIPLCYDLSEVDPSESTLPQDYDLSQANSSGSNRPQDADLDTDNGDFHGGTDTLENRKGWNRATLNKDLLALKGQDLNIINQISIFLTSLLLICGFPLLALIFSVASIVLYGFQKDRTLLFHKNVPKYFLINCIGAILSFGTWSLMAQAMEDPDRTLRLVFAALVREFAGFVLLWFIYVDYNSQGYETEALNIVEVKLRILGGRNLVAKDKNIFGKKKSSDPFVQIYYARNYVGKTEIVWKSLNPVWKRNIFSIIAVPNMLAIQDVIECHIFDHDKLSANDSMGTLRIPIPENFNEKIRRWYPVTKGSGENYCHNATGEVEVEVHLLPRLSNKFKSQLSRTASVKGMKRETFRKLNYEGDGKKRVSVNTRDELQSLGEKTAEGKNANLARIGS